MAQHRSLWQSLVDYIRGESHSNTTITVSEEPDAEAPDTPLSQTPSAYDINLYPSLDQVMQLRPGRAHLHGQFKQVSGRYVRRGMHVTEGVFSDDTGSVRVVWFNRPYVAAAIRAGEIYELRGNYELKRQRLQITNPQFHKLSDGCRELEETSDRKIGRTVTSVKPTSPVPQHNLWASPIEGRGLSSTSKWRALRDKVLARDNFTCVECGSHVYLTVDHKLELSLGGTNALSNLQTLCKDCHEDKHFRNFLDRKFDAVDDYGENYEPTIKIKAIVKAMKARKGIAIDYTDREGVHSYRVIHPKKIYKGYRYNGTVVNKRMVYVDAYCELDQAGRTFRISRMKLLGPALKPDVILNSYT